MTNIYTKTIICLANSRKTTGRCIAGKEVSDGNVSNWIRPISKRPTGELSEEERRYENGQDPKLLDIIRIPLLEPRPHAFQTENHLIAEEYYWQHVGEFAREDLGSILDAPDGTVLWDNSAQSSYSGLNDRVDQTTASHLQGSLRLIRVGDLVVVVAAEGAAFGNPKRRVRGRFTFSGKQYWLSITDPIAERSYLAEPDGQHLVGAATLCISLGEPYEGYAYKLIAAIIR